MRRITGDLQAEGRRWALVGGIAVGIRAEPRTTRDVDIAVAVSDDRDAEALVRALLSRGYQVFAMLEQDATKRLATVRLQTQIEGRPGALVDLLFASSGIEPELVLAATPFEVFPHLDAPVASIGHLIAARGFNRGRDLLADLVRAQADTATSKRLG